MQAPGLFCELKYKDQYIANLRLALPVVLAQLGQVLVQVADNVMVGRYGGEDPVPLAAVSFGGSVWFLLFIAAIGFSAGITPLVGELYAQGDRQRPAMLLQNGVVFYTLVGVTAMVLLLAFEPVLFMLGQPQSVVEASLTYYRLLACCIPFIMLFGAFKQFLEGVGNTRAVMVMLLAANMLNIFLNWVFIYGRLGAPEYGAAGAGVATLLSRIVLPAMVIVYFMRRPHYRIYMRGFSPVRVSRTALAQLTRMGLPIALQMFLETAAFVGTGIMMGWFGEVAISANQITTSLANCAFMIVMSVGAATTIRVSHCYGLRDFATLSRAVHASYHLGLVWNAFTAAVFILFRHEIPYIFTANTEVAELTSRLLIFVALFQLSDGVQNISVGTLRGIQDVRIIMPIAFLAYIVLNLPLGYLLGFVWGMGPEGLILGFTFGLTAAGALMMARIKLKTARLRRSARV